MDEESGASTEEREEIYAGTGESGIEKLVQYNTIQYNTIQYNIILLRKLPGRNLNTYKSNYNK